MKTVKVQTKDGDTLNYCVDNFDAASNAVYMSIMDGEDIVLSIPHQNVSYVEVRNVDNARADNVVSILDANKEPTND